MSLCIVYLASPKSHHIYNDPTQESRLELLQGSVQVVRRLFPNIDILVFHEDYADQEFRALPEVTKFIQVDFSGHEQYLNESLRRPYGYLMMCRFFSGVMQSHPEVTKYTHYMRLDDDSYFMEPYLISEKVSEFIGHDYVYRSTFGDQQDQQSLWEFTIEFLRNEGYGAHIETLKKELRKKHFLHGDTYSGLAPYNNFHVASQRIWQNPMIQRYIAALEASHGILQKGWMDANIHAMIMYALTLFIGMKIRSDTTFGYRHNRHVSRLGDVGVDYKNEFPFGLSQRQPTRSASPTPNTQPEPTLDCSEGTDMPEDSSPSLCHPEETPERSDSPGTPSQTHRPSDTQLHLEELLLESE